MGSSPPSGPHNGNGRSPPAGEEYDRDRESALASDQTASDLDQSASDTDHSVADADQASSARDQLLSSSDQRASDRDQAASDVELDANPEVTAATERAHERSREERRLNTAQRTSAAVLRAHTATERFDWADVRDQNSRLRDLAAEARDRSAAARDRADNDLLGPAVKARAQAGADRAIAASDRERAAADRAQAAIDRKHARAALRDAHFDELTGTYRRGMGSHELECEIDRARRGDRRLVLAFVDVDDLKGFNDREGHAAGDALLIDVVKAMRSRLRSYDPVIRFGGDEFICALANTDLADAHRRFEEIQLALSVIRADCSVSVGFAQMRDGDTAEELTSRGDAALYEAKRRKKGATRPAGRVRIIPLFSRLRQALGRGASNE
jgi:diguanylate cyclase (GGDEF)-like protein